MFEQDELAGFRGKVFRLGLKVWVHEGTHPRERDEWRGEVYDRLEPRLYQAFRHLERLPDAVYSVIARIERGERGRPGPDPPARGDDAVAPDRGAGSD